VLALGALILVSAAVAFVRRRRHQEAEAMAAATQVREPLRRRPVELPSRMDVVEGSMTGTHTARQAAMRGADIAPVAVAAPPDLSDVARSISATDPVDFDVGAEVAANERVAESDRPYIIDARDDTMAEESSPTMRMGDTVTAPTVRQPAPRPEQPINDEQHTLTIVELDMLRQDYETEHTLTQQASQELRDALADLKATKAAQAASSETATLETPLVSDEDTLANAPTARIRAK